MSKRKLSGTKPGPGITRAGGRGSNLVEVGRSLPPDGSFAAMADALPAHWWQSYGFKKWRKRVILVLVSLLLASLIFVGWKFYENIGRLFGGNFFGLFGNHHLRGEDRGRVNILLAGYSADDPGHGGANLTDSIMIVSIDTNQHTAFMVSIPRDLWVQIPGTQNYGKINEIYNDGLIAHNGSSKAGMKQLEAVVSKDFGLPLDYYALVNYAAVKDSVNAVGGIDVTIKSCDPRGLYDPNIDWSTGGPLVNLSNGKHHLNGRQALDLARARGDPSPHGIAYGYCQSDYDRTSYQRQMLVALKSKAISAGVITNPFKLGKLLDAVGKNVKTDFQTNEVRRLYDLVKPIDGKDIRSVGLNNVDGKGKSLIEGFTTDNGLSAQRPTAGTDNYSEIQQFIKKLTATKPAKKESKHHFLIFSW